MCCLRCTLAWLQAHHKNRDCASKRYENQEVVPEGPTSIAKAANQQCDVWNHETEVSEAGHGENETSEPKKTKPGIVGA